MRVYCERAAKFGEHPIKVDVEPRTVTIILNPSANKRKATDEFEKYCAPLLHLAGICVNVVKTESEGHAKNLINSIENTDAIVVAGGDGTLSEVITGLLRRTNENTNGLIPLGKKRVALKLS
jgi:acylglycerol kinase